MVNLLAKLFIKDYQNVSNEKVRGSYGTLAGIFGIVTNFILFGFKVVIGIISSSISIIADAINNLSDMGSSLLTIVGFKISSKPADKDHPFGHQRVEYIIGLIISMIITFIGAELLKSSIDKMIHPQVSKITNLTIIILVFAIVLKLLQGLFYVKVAKRIDSIALKATSKDSFNDVLSTLFVLIGSFLSLQFDYNFDGIFGLMVSGFIIFSGIKLLLEAIKPLIGEKPNKNLIDNIVKDVLGYEGVLGIHDLLGHMYGPSKCFISLHVEVSSKTNILESHELIDLIEKNIKEKYNVEIVIHMDPIEVDNEELIGYKQIIKEVIDNIDENLHFHDVRFVKGEKNTNLIFDVLVPFDYRLSDEELVNLINDKIGEKVSNITCVINVDKDYQG